VLFDFEKISKNLEPKAILKSNNSWVLSGMIHVCTCWENAVLKGRNSPCKFGEVRVGRCFEIRKSFGF
jgi:hypothetical protein